MVFRFSKIVVLQASAYVQRSNKSQIKSMLQCHEKKLQSAKNWRREFKPRSAKKKQKKCYNFFCISFEKTYFQSIFMPSVVFDTSTVWFNHARESSRKNFNFVRKINSLFFCLTEEVGSANQFSLPEIKKNGDNQYRCRRRRSKAALPVESQKISKKSRNHLRLVQGVKKKFCFY